MSVELLKPSDFVDVFPNMSKTGDVSLEGVAQDIMKLLVSRGNKWAPVTWGEYSEHYCGCREWEFEEVADYCTSAEKAQSFSRYWYDAGAYAYSYLRLCEEGNGEC